MLLSDEHVRELLAAVGAGTRPGAEDFDRSFEELELDSLARMEIASRVQARFGIDIEEALTPDETPAGLLALVNDRLLAARGGAA
ncbi:acyl carrier protein [Amycolatopsis thailandensis]|uniref:acyl carrier protein n=1 Tax=Amycolatopsis thailandensis TaxID=589330 RepID=UPI003665DC1E